MVETVAHAADLGMVFYTGDKFPARYKAGVFTAQHGSWNCTVPVGARVLFTPLNEDGTAGEQEVFAEGWLTGNGEYIGRPVALAQLPRWLPPRLGRLSPARCIASPTVNE